MTAIAAFRIVYSFCRVFGVFPYKPVGPNEFRLGESALWQGRIILGLTIVVRLVIVTLDIKYNLYSISRTFMTAFRVGNTSLLHLMTVVTYRTVFKGSRSMCAWLNRMGRLYSSVRGNSRVLLRVHRCIICYDVLFFFVTNVLTLASLWTNAKFINGWIALSDSLCFLFFLSIQNVHLLGFITLINLAKMSFERISQVLEEQKLRASASDVLLGELRMLRLQHLTVTDYVDFLSSFFGFYLFIYISWSFISTLCSSVSVVIFDPKDALTLGLWVFYHPCQTFLIIYLCAAVVEQANKSVHVLLELIIESEDPEIREEAEIFSLQLQHRTTEFSVCGFFVLNFKLVASATGVIATYIIALIQIQPTPVLEDAITREL